MTLRFHLPVLRIPDTEFPLLPGISSSKPLLKILLASWYAQKFAVATVARRRSSLRAANNSLHPEMPCWSLVPFRGWSYHHGKSYWPTSNSQFHDGIAIN